MKKKFRLLLPLVILIYCIQIISGCTLNVNKSTLSANPQFKDRLQLIKEKGVLTVASSNYKPFAYVDSKTGQYAGIDMDIISEVARQLGINKIKMKVFPFEDLLNVLNSDDSIDIATNAIYITPEREKIVAFTKPIYKESDAIVVQKNSSINSVKDLKNTIIGVTKGTAHLPLAQEWKNEGFIRDIALFDSDYDLFSAINKDIVDAGIADSAAANYYSAKYKNLFLRTLKDYTPKLSGLVGLAVRKEDTTLLNALNEKIDELKANGMLNKILIENGLNESNFVN